ncbi:TorF family putative porin [Spongiibacter tropicus]|uniref:TorF family putative porin n=1 Tax=Spongiibacter tropicus TaxID=454602 RepID=UPI0035BE36CD
MNAWKKMLGVAVVTTAPMAASAGEISGNVAWTTDYSFRGVSQTNEKMAVQGGFDYGFESGAYVGVWASNVNFSDGKSSVEQNSTETDYYVGYAFNASESVSIDLSFWQFTYPGAESAANYQEYVASVSVSDFTFGLVYSPDYFGDGNGDATVISVDYSLALQENMSMDFHVGQTTTEEDGLVDGDDSYVDYLVGLNYDVAGVTLSLAWVGTDIGGGDNTEDRAIFTISKSL